ncbi:WG repeat-containing protein [Flavilitoribacter nigricans]|uniref:WG repeat-containing protein n=1 Tax=Flavilitoribacter nigricans (strain ATCC 23147 / DSM 23189 / NBRC 102662 / NCIMB 1420 / SS-2) TaxID=1122177 RepID=A0A2D0NFF6_FLAN2|nr:WG repeat-containing protein [Flavilitoribacter nigricans]PHN07148.1 hypothetical protein CRP01_07940 [Flavilitoribacter nigricans DSM 23189 = NBRC 102662]
MKSACSALKTFSLLLLLAGPGDLYGQTIEWLIEPTYPYGEMLNYQYPVLGNREEAYTYQNGEVVPFKGAFFRPLDVHDNEKYDYYVLGGDSLYLKERGTLNLSKGIYWSDAAYSHQTDISAYNDHVLYQRNDSVFYNNVGQIAERYIGPSFYIGPINSRYITKIVHGEKNKTILLDFTGRIIAEEGEGEQYLDNYPHLIIVKTGERFRILNLEGEEVMPTRGFSSYAPRCVYNDSVLIVQEGIASVFFKWDKVVDPGTVFTQVDHFPIAVSGVSHSLFKVRKGSKYGIMDSNFELIVPLKFKSISAALSEDGYIYGNAPGQSTLFNRLGEEIITLPYDGIRFVCEDRYAVMKNNRWGVVNGQNEVIIDLDLYFETSYPNIQSMEVNGHPLIFVSVDRTKVRKIYDRDGNLLGQFVYTDETGEPRLFYDFVWHARALTPSVIEGAVAQGLDLNAYWIRSVQFGENDRWWGIVDRAGNEVLPAKYDKIHRIPGTQVFICRNSSKQYGLFRIR